MPKNNTNEKQNGHYTKNGKLRSSFYEKELLRLQEEMVKIQYWVKAQNMRVVIVCEGRDAAGKGGTIKRITERTNPRVVRVVALGIPSDREKNQWYFQRWVAHLPADGEIAIFDRSWYTRAITEHVMGFCTEDQYREFLRSCPQFERMLVNEEQERRFQKRSKDPRRRWKLSPMDIESRAKWEEYSRAKDRMFDYTDIKQAPWYVVNAEDKKKARLNCMSHIISMIPYEDILPGPIDLPPVVKGTAYVRPPIDEQTFVPDAY
ncbi:MAG: polyphosphate kinase 2 [Chloroflexi bacterium]|nr:polyphosphate kinase 2 [Chloroflexota bacterium]